MSGNLMCPVDRLRSAPRCHAAAKRTGKRCQGPSVKGWRVCRFHGAHGGAPRGKRHPNYKHGLRTVKSEDCWINGMGSALPTRGSGQ